MLGAPQVVEGVLQLGVLRLHLVGQFFDQVQPLHLHRVLAEHLQRTRHIGEFVVALDLDLHFEVPLRHAPRRAGQCAHAHQQSLAEELPCDIGRRDREKRDGQEKPDTQLNQRARAVRSVPCRGFGVAHEHLNAVDEFGRGLLVARDQLGRPPVFGKLQAASLEDTFGGLIQILQLVDLFLQLRAHAGPDSGKRTLDVPDRGLHSLPVCQQHLRVVFRHGLGDQRSGFVLIRLEVQETLVVVEFGFRSALRHRSGCFIERSQAGVHEELLIVDLLLEHELQRLARVGQLGFRVLPAAPARSSDEAPTRVSGRCSPPG